MASRANGAGSVYQRKSDGRWCGALPPQRTASGGTRRPIVTAATRKGAERKLRDRIAEIEAAGGGSLAPRATVSQWAEKWLELTEETLRPNAWKANRSAVRRHINPTIGHRRLAELTPDDVRAVTQAILKAGLKEATALRAHRVLSGMLRAAAVEGYVVPSRLFLVKGPAATPGDQDAIPIPDALRLLEVASTLPHGSRWAAALLNGLRQGEALGLTWEMVDLEAGAMLLSWQLQPLEYLDREAETFRVPRGYEVRRLSGALHLVRPKSTAGWRLVPIVPWLLEALKAWREVAPASPHDLVWPRLDGRPSTAAGDLEEWHAIQCTAGVGHHAGRYYGTQEARHTTATLLMELKVDPKVITAILGHSSIVVSRGYMHTSQDEARRALEAVAGRLSLMPPAAG